MSQEIEAAPAAVEVATGTPPGQTCQSPPAAPTPAREQLPDPRLRLLQLASELMRSPNHRLIIEYLRLRRAVV